MKITLRTWTLLLGLNALFGSDAYGWDFSVSTNGNSIVVSISGMQSQSQTCAGASVDLPNGGAHCSQPGMPSHAETLRCHRVGVHTVYAYVADDTTGEGYETRSTTATVTEPPPLTCPAFSVAAQTWRPLTHKYGTEDWPLGQRHDGQAEFLFKPILVDTGTTIHLKVFDPQDDSPYRTSAAPGDNLDTAAGTLSLSPHESGSKSLSFSVGDEFLTTIYLNTTQFAAGDNYLVKASTSSELLTDPEFVCDAAHGCVQAFPVTAWKRVYLEKKEMFRRGALIVGSPSAGSTQVRVQVPTGLRWNDVGLARGNAIRLLHAPRLDGLDLFPDFHFEDAVIAAVDRVHGDNNRRVLTLETPLAHSYTEDNSYETALADGVSDGVGYLAGGTYGRNEAYLHSVFGSAYIEFWSVNQAIREIPYLPTVRRPHRVANKWFENTPVNLATYARPGNPNVKHVLAGSGARDAEARNPDATVSPFAFGETGIDVSPPPPVEAPIPQPNYSWTWVGGIEQAVTLRGGVHQGLDAWTFNGENLVHELAHTFNVNAVFYYGSDFGHCSRTMAGSPALNCKMRSHMDPLFDARQTADGIIGFHYSSDDDSEYMTIRRKPEPLATPAR